MTRNITHVKAAQHDGPLQVFYSKTLQYAPSSVDISHVHNDNVITNCDNRIYDENIRITEFLFMIYAKASGVLDIGICITILYQ